MAKLQQTILQKRNQGRSYQTRIGRGGARLSPSPARGG